MSWTYSVHKYDEIINVIMGEAPNADNLVPINFHNEMWSYLIDILF